MVYSELLVVKREDVSNCDYAQWTKHRLGMLDVTWYGKAKFCRGRLDGPDGALFEPGGWSALQERFSKRFGDFEAPWLRNSKKRDSILKPLA